MPGIQLSRLAETNDAVLCGDDAEVSAVTIDSRSVSKGSLFVALRGERVDGHQFVASVKGQGAVGAVVECKQDVDIAQIVVPDAAIALAGIASCNRAAFKGKVIAVTGSAGKTTCKNMLAAILSISSDIVATKGNLNNELGVPLTVSQLNESHQYAVIEMGAAQAGDIRYLTDIARPHISVVTNVAEAHIGRFGSLAVTASTKGEIYASLSDGGVAVINRDDVFANQWRKTVSQLQADVGVVEFSLTDTAADIYAENIVSDIGGVKFTVRSANDEYAALDISLQLLGRHNVSNALAAIAIARALHVAESDIAAGLVGLSPEPGRLAITAAKNQLTLIDDSYNANPQAMCAAIDVICQAQFAEHIKRVLVLGDMAELGEDAAQKHCEVGHYAAAQGIDCLLATGALAEHYMSGFAAEGASGARVLQSKTAIAELLLEQDFRGAAVLVKGSRSAAMDHVVNRLSADIGSSAGKGDGTC